jgi:hypothetical protein
MTMTFPNTSPEGRLTPKKDRDHRGLPFYFRYMPISFISLGEGASLGHIERLTIRCPKELIVIPQKGTLLRAGERRIASYTGLAFRLYPFSGGVTGLRGTYLTSSFRR